MLSFNGNKIITTGMGGAIMTNSLALYKNKPHHSTVKKRSQMEI